MEAKLYMGVLFIKDQFYICISCSTNITNRYFPWHFFVFTNRKQIGFGFM